MFSKYIESTLQKCFERLDISFNEEAIDFKPGVPIADFQEVPTSFGYGKYMHTNIGRRRKSMPQIWGDHSLTQVIHWLSDKYNVKKSKMKLSKLKPAQREMYDEKIKDKIQNIDLDKVFFIISDDGYLVDSHHDWAAAIEKYGDDTKVDVYKVDVTINKLLHILNKLKTTSKADE